MTGDYSILAALAAGLISFLSPCVLPLVPAYLGQLTSVAVASQDLDGRPSRWTAVRHALLYVAGFGLVFTLLGVTATFAGGALALYMRQIRIVAGAILVLLGLSLAGILRIGFLERTWRPLDTGASTALMSTTGGMTLGAAGVGLGGTGMGGTGMGGTGMGGRLGSRLVSGRAGYGTSFALGTIFALGWTPCIGAFLGSVLMMAAGANDKLSAGILLLAYTAGLGLPFVAVAAFYDRARGPMRFLVRHGRAVSLVGGLLIAAFGLAMMFDMLTFLSRYASIV
ncbi:MAG: cytochrome c biogenesis CcdA family protein [Candidatus Limnocylindrales bacterium]